MKVTYAQTREPITATCGRCGNEEAVILPDPAPRGTFYCKPCFEAHLRATLPESEMARRRRLLIEWNAFVNGRATTQAELDALDWSVLA